MGIGTSIALVAIGAIFAFALNFRIAGLDIDVIGYILMAAGLLGLLFTALLRTRRSEPKTVVREQPAEREVVKERPAEREVVREQPTQRETTRHRDTP